MSSCFDCLGCLCTPVIVANQQDDTAKELALSKVVLSGSMLYIVLKYHRPKCFQSLLPLGSSALFLLYSLNAGLQSIHPQLEMCSYNACERHLRYLNAQQSAMAPRCDTLFLSALPLCCCVYTSPTRHIDNPSPGTEHVGKQCLANAHAPVLLLLLGVLHTEPSLSSVNFHLPHRLICKTWSRSDIDMEIL